MRAGLQDGRPLYLDGNTMARDLLQLYQALERLQTERSAPCSWRPPADIYRAPSGWLVKFDLAGVNPNEVQLSLCGRRLTIAGVRRDATVHDGCSSYSMEISYNRFERSIDLPFETEGLEMQTEYRDGMLLVALQRPEEQG
jgi:HSP20 family protein